LAATAPPIVVPAPLSHELCLPTERNIEGPYYRAGAPESGPLAGKGAPGLGVVLLGTVLSQDCKTPLASALLDVWQADADGRYDNDGSFGPGETPLRMRGKLRADAQGRYAVKTIVPGRYLNGRVYRPAHLHVKLSADAHAPLTTQLYFPDDPYNEGDPYIHKSLVMQTERSDGGLRAHYDFVLPVA
jgi:catechol 1,2-dioxygenase